MPFTIDVRRDEGVFISTLTPGLLRGGAFEQYFQEIIRINKQFVDDGQAQVYHVIVLSGVKPKPDFSSVLSLLSLIRQSKTMIELRKRLNTRTVLVTTSAVIVQFIETMLSNDHYGGRRTLVFPTLEKALDFIRFERAHAADEDTSGS